MIQVLLPFAFDLVKRLFPDDPDKQREAQQKVLETVQTADLEFFKATADLNKQEASHASIFVAGWRPFIGWICASGLAYAYVLRPFLVDLAYISGFKTSVLPSLPDFNIDGLTTLLLAMLGIGGLRTIEKIKGVTK